MALYWSFANKQSEASNKKYVTCIHLVDRLKLGRVLHRELTKENRKLDILVQVNTSYEESKFGVAPEETLNLI